MLLGSVELARWQALRWGGLECHCRLGQRVGRGMADLGFEEFCVIGENRLVSLLTGKTADIVEAERARLFWIPSTEELIEVVERHGICVRVLKQVDDGRSWELHALILSGTIEWTYRATTIRDLFFTTLCRIHLGEFWEQELSRKIPPRGQLIARSIHDEQSKSI
jgi:hypothetical protein